MLLCGLALLVASCTNDEGVTPLGTPDFSGVTAYDASDFVVVDSAKVSIRELITARIRQIEAQDDGANSTSADDEIDALKQSLLRVDSIEHAMTDSLSQLYGTNGVDLSYLALGMKKVRYKTKSADGQDVWLSALVAYSGLDFNCFPFYTFCYYKPNSLLIGCHATITSESQSPTSLMNGTSMDFLYTDVGQIVIDGRTNNVGGFEGLTVIPDYQGWGDTYGQNHPYLMQDATARQVVDAATHTLSWFTENCSSMEDDWRTAIIGFSQGGSTAMATMKHIEQTPGLSDNLRLAGAVCGDGPYSPLATLKRYVSDGKVNMPEALALIIMGACDYDVSMKRYAFADFFTDKFIAIGIEKAIREKNKTSAQLEDLIKANGVTCFEGNYWHLSDIMRPEIIDYFAGRDVEDQYKGKCEALFNALYSNDLSTSGWKPEHRLIVYHATDDPTVPIDNYWSVARVMNNGNFMGIRSNEPDVCGANHTDVGTVFYTGWDKFLLTPLLDEDYSNDAQYWRPGLWRLDREVYNCDFLTPDEIPAN